MLGLGFGLDFELTLDPSFDEQVRPYSLTPTLT